MKKITFIILFCFTSIILNAQIIIKDLDNNDVDFREVLRAQERNQPLLIFTWANYHCQPCEQILDELQKKYSFLKEKYNLRVIIINVDSDKDEKFKKHYENEKYSRSMGRYTSITDFVKKYERAQKWDFEQYVDEYDNYKALKGSDAPYISISVNGKLKFENLGYYSLSSLERVGFKTEHLKSNEEATAEVLIQIISSMYSYEAYLDKGFHFTIKESGAEYKRTTVKIDDLYEHTFSYVSGEPHSKATFKEMTGDTRHGNSESFYKNGNTAEKVMFDDGVAQGTGSIFYENGQLNWEGEFKNNKYDGLWKNYYSTGRPKVENIWEEGKLMEVKYYYDPYGNPLDKGTISGGYGTRKMYDEEGNLEETKEYENGVEM